MNIQSQYIYYYYYFLFAQVRARQLDGNDIVRFTHAWQNHRYRSIVADADRFCHCALYDLKLFRPLQRCDNGQIFEVSLVQRPSWKMSEISVRGNQHISAPCISLLMMCVFCMYIRSYPCNSRIYSLYLSYLAIPKNN